MCRSENKGVILNFYLSYAYKISYNVGKITAFSSF